jgi:hypothetical protein
MGTEDGPMQHSPWPTEPNRSAAPGRVGTPVPGWAPPSAEPGTERARGAALTGGLFVPN